MFGDHVQFGNGEVVLRSARTHRHGCVLADYSYLMSEMCLQISATGSKFKNPPSVFFGECVVTVRTTQATLNVELLCIAARGGSLCRSQCDQQGRCNDQQEYSLHGILRGVSPSGDLKFCLGI